MNHHHEFSNEKKTLSVIVVSTITMVLEILFGFITGSMALLADGFHMGTHVLALGLTLVSYILIRKFKNSKSFPKGTDKIGYMFQNDCLFPWLTILDNCLIGLKIQKQLTKENIDYVKQLLTNYGLKDFINSYPSNLSGGMKQRVA